MKPAYHLFLLIGLFIFTGCTTNPSIPEDFDYGTLKGGKYSNNFFKFTMDVPLSWDIQTDKETKEIFENGKRLAAGNDEKLKKSIKASMVTTASLLAAYKYKEGVAENYNPNFVLLAESLKAYPKIKTGSDYLDNVRTVLSSSKNIKYKNIDFVNSLDNMSGATFYKLNAVMVYEGIEINQYYFVTVKNDFALVFIASYIDDAQKAELEKIRKSINFGKSTK